MITNNCAVFVGVNKMHNIKAHFVVGVHSNDNTSSYCITVWNIKLMIYTVLPYKIGMYMDVF